MDNAIVEDGKQYLTLEGVADLIGKSIDTTRTYMNGYRFTKFATKIRIGNQLRLRRAYLCNKHFLNRLQDFYVAINGYENRKIKEALKEV